MGFFHSEKKRAESVVLIDISASSVAGAYAHYREGDPPALLYTRRFPVETREQESPERAMLRALQILGDTLIRDGAPVLLRETGSGSARTILVSIDMPWQKTSMHSEHVGGKNPFIFTRDLVIEELKKTAIAVPGHLLADESVIATLLNGYTTNNPYGKKANRASIVVLTSCIDEKVARDILPILQSLYHTKRIVPIAGSSLRYQALRRVFPHERNVLIMDAMSPMTSVALIRKGLLVAVAETSDPVSKKTSETDGRIAELTELAKEYPLPRTIFLLARDSEIPSLRKALATADGGKLWLSDDPPKIIPILASHLTGLVRQTTAAPSDIPLLLMALYYQGREIEVR
ncbi:MAG: hypothetical protein ACYC6X_02910 [Minisyncoccota bacterium]